MFFHKELFCENCHAPINKKDMCTFDYSYQRRNKTGKKIILCQDCCRKELIKDLREHIQKAVIIQPVNKYDAYTFYGFKMLGNGVDDYTTLKYIQDMKSFLPKGDEICNCCSSAANYTWCTTNIYDQGIPWNMDINLAEKENCIYLCTDCLINLLIRTIKEQNIIFKAIYPIINDEVGIFTPWMS